MVTRWKPRRKGGLFVLFLVCGGLGASGCASAGLAAVGPLTTAFQIVGGRTVERTVSADRETTWTATVDTLSRMEVRIQETEQGEEAWALKGIGEEVELYAELTRVTPRMTKVSLRVEAGGLTADKQTAEEILNQVALALEPPPALAGDKSSDERDALATAVTSLEGEILHLKAVIEEENKATRAASPPPPQRDGVTGDGFFWGSGILVIPSSYGVPVLPGATDTSAARVPPPPRRNVDVPVQAEAPPQTHPHSDAQEVLAAPLVPVEVLTPVQSLDGRQRVGK